MEFSFHSQRPWHKDLFPPHQITGKPDRGGGSAGWGGLRAGDAAKGRSGCPSQLGSGPHAQGRGGNPPGVTSKALEMPGMCPCSGTCCAPGSEPARAGQEGEAPGRAGVKVPSCARRCSASSELLLVQLRV